MKSIKYILGAALCTLAFTSCMDGNDGLFNDDWKDADTSVSPYGNSAIQETNVLTIAQLKQKYEAAVKANYREPQSGLSYAEVTEDIQIKGYVTANDVSGNIYNEIYVQDETGAIPIRIKNGNLYAMIPVGSEILIDMKGLYVGNYRMQPSVGMPSTVSSGNYKGYAQLGNMSNAVWLKHFKLTGNTKTAAQIEEDYLTLFADGSSKTTWTAYDDGGKLGILKNVTFKSGSYFDNDQSTNIDIPYNAESKYADAKYETSVSWYFNEQPIGSKKGEIKVMLYNSMYASFAAELLPQGKVNIKGIFKEYQTNPNYPAWEIMIRSLDDITPAE